MPPADAISQTRPPFTWPAIYARLLQREDLSPADASWAMAEIIDGRASDAQIAAFALGLRGKGESSGEISAMVDVLRGRAVPMRRLADAVDVVGTGGDGAKTVNISTSAAIVAAAAGARVVKHGSRAVSSASGASDVLSALGIHADLGPDEVLSCVEQVGIGFCFAPRFHSGMRHAAAARASLGVPTVFNILGPLANPAFPGAVAVGCADERLAPVMAEVLARQGVIGVVMRGEDGLDECTVTAPTRLWLMGVGAQSTPREADQGARTVKQKNVQGSVTNTTQGAVREFAFDAADLGVPRVGLNALRGGDPVDNAAIIRAVFDGQTGPVADVIALNAAVALTAYGALDTPAVMASKESFMDALRDNFTLTRTTIESGAALSTLDRWAELSTRLAG